MIVDAFTFFNELDLLRIRLYELKDVVDRFVLVEAERTYSNQPKKLYYLDHKDEFKDYPIDHVVVRDVPQTNGYWDREVHQRNAIMRGLQKLPGDVLVLMGDVDEIPSAEAVVQASKLSAPVKVFEQRFFYYGLNVQVAGRWYGTRMVSQRNLAKFGPQAFRHARGETIRPGGWHFSHLYGKDWKKYARKFQAGSHQEYNTPEYTNLESIERRVMSLHDVFDRNDIHKMSRVAVDHTWPRLVHQRLSEFERYVL